MGKFRFTRPVPLLLQAIVVSASLGALIGTIQQWGKQQEQAKADGFAGVRTFVLWALLGTTSAAITQEHVPAAFGIALALVGLHLILRGVFGRIDFKIGFTTVAASLLTFLMGGLVYWGETQAAVMLSASTMLLSGFKQPIHAWTRKFSEQDIRSTLQFVAITGVILPIVPDRGYGPYQAFNPFSMWLMVVLISGLGFVGYILMRLLGARAGIALTGLVGGLASSTATTLAFSRRSREDPAASGGYALAVVLACTVMLGRVAAVLLTLQRELFLVVWPGLLVMAVPGLGYAAWALLVRPASAETVKPPAISNPLGLGTAIKFAVIYAVVTLLVRAVGETELSRGLLAVGFVSGLTDVDAITLTTADGVRNATLTAALAGQVIIVAAVANTLMKGGMAVAFGSPQLRRLVGMVLGLTLLAGLLAVWRF
jgi:uncharacterized membrane protein (DUF4010 family)